MNGRRSLVRLSTDWQQQQRQQLAGWLAVCANWEKKNGRT
jgi:hypothetical protein